MYAEQPLPEPEASSPTKFTELPVEERESYWYDHVYQPHTRQLTIRAVVMGLLLGAIMSVSNLYVGLRIGWGFGVTITAGILAFAIFKALQSAVSSRFFMRYVRLALVGVAAVATVLIYLFGYPIAAIAVAIVTVLMFGLLSALDRWMAKDEFTDLENNAMQSVASAAGAMSSAGLVTAIPALLLLDGTQLGWLSLAVFIGAVSFLGVVVAIPLKRQMINIDQLPFPSGIAAAATIRGLHEEGSKAMKQAKALGISALIAAIWAWFESGNKAILGKFLGKASPLAIGLPDAFNIFPKTIQGIDASDKLTLNADVSLLLYAAGAIMGMRSAVSILIGGVINWFFVAPWLINNHITVYVKHKGVFEWVPVTGGFSNVAKWSTWPGTGMLTVAVLIGLAFQWRSLGRAFGGILDLVRTTKTPVDPKIAGIEVPNSWFAVGLLLSGIACILVTWFMFHISPLLGVLSVVLAIVLSMVATRVAGETDIAPIGAMGKMTQFTYAAVSPGHAVTNLMAANVTAGAAAHTADLLCDLKSGYLLGANPRQQFLAQLFGVCAGTLACVPAYYLMVPNASVLGTKFAAPAALVWAATAQVLSQGLNTIPSSALHLAFLTMAFGALVTIIEQIFPQSKKFLPSPSGLGLAFVLPFGNCLSMFVGAVIAWVITKWNKDVADEYIVTVSSGLIAGESLMAIVVMALLLAFHLT